jgi:hypothetical protein
MKGAHNLISVIELRRLLIELKDKHPDVCIRFRILGEMWFRNFVKIVYVTEKGAILHDEQAGKLLAVLDLNSVVQLELDGRFQNYQPYLHYDVKPLPEFKSE